MSEGGSRSAGAAPSGFDLTVEHRYPSAGPPTVYSAYLDLHREPLPDWIMASELDLRVGGSWTVSFLVDGASFTEERLIDELEPPHLIAYSMSSAFSDGTHLHTHVRIAFDQDGSGSRVRLTQSGFPTAEVRDVFAGGWPGVFDGLAEHIATI